ncbi:HAL/PAL/TAL family ammonia-lyase [Dethiosulfovibrio salsuginis]|uniref:Histidine ammonia-lyase n=1 Tax=Dethiosulfovibrio salsuginis TaxID=561720 RepID=A0A1X7IZU0_9BACT|nr:aromatic amino acid ammonia-lyase [Dethiosulfovibrio salsuginis]SMG20013.1 histidine ammonia-lyase [Dethiosulfovibrio salsuginis]
MKPLILDGASLKIEDLVEVARGNRPVEIAPEAMDRVEKSWALLQRFATSGEQKVYGMNTGVGVNKDREISGRYYAEYNKNMLLAHCDGVAPYGTADQVRAVMVGRLNTLLVGRTGMHPDLVRLHRDFLNKGIHPVLPLRGSVGQGDITNLSLIGLAMIGEGAVEYKGQTMTGAQAMEKEGLSPCTLGPKDGLSLVSSNALGAGLGALLVHDMEELIDTADLAYSMTMEGFKGNTCPLDPLPYRYRPYDGQRKSMELARSFLEGSYLWLPDVSESIQDPLSIRCSVQVHGALRDSLEYTKKLLEIHLNSSDDNPCIVFEEERIIPCANFEPLNWVLAFEMMGIALSHLSRTAAHRTLRMGSPRFTGLARFLTPTDAKVHAFGTIQKVFCSLDSEVRHLSNPVSADYSSLSEDMEDRGNNTPYVMLKTASMVDTLRYILGIEMIHSSQAIDLRKATRLGKGTAAAKGALREEIPFLDTDRNLSLDVAKVHKLISQGTILKAAREATSI